MDILFEMKIAFLLFHTSKSPEGYYGLVRYSLKAIPIRRRDSTATHKKITLSATSRKHKVKIKNLPPPRWCSMEDRHNKSRREGFDGGAKRRRA